MVNWLLFRPPTLLGELSNLGYHGSFTLAVSSTYPCLLLNLGIISRVVDGAMVLFKLALMKLYFGLMNLMLIPRLGNV